ncbi:MAG: helix-turn-helix transcriptional regulator [Candidatus Izemoplasmatales bacterium]
MTIDVILIAIRKELNVSQEQLARDLNVSFTTLNRWENNRSKPSRLAMMRITDYCKEKGVSEETISVLEHA